MGVRGDTRLLHRKRARPAEVTVILGAHSWRARAYRASGTALAAAQIPPAKHSSSFPMLVYGDRHDTSTLTGKNANSLYFYLGYSASRAGAPSTTDGDGGGAPTFRAPELLAGKGGCNQRTKSSLRLC